MIDTHGNVNKTIRFNMCGEPIFGNYPTNVYVDVGRAMKILVSEKERGLKELYVNPINQKVKITAENKLITVNDIAMMEDGVICLAVGGYDPGVMILSQDFHWSHMLITGNTRYNKEPKAIRYSADNNTLAVAFKNQREIEFYKLSYKASTKND